MRVVMIFEVESEDELELMVDHMWICQLKIESLKVDDEERVR